MTNQRNALSKLNENLNILQEREAKYAGNAPLELLNQIDDHKLAISLTQQALADELSQVEWEEALKPLLLAVNNGQVVNIQANTYIAGDVQGDVIAGDKVEGDKILGNKIITNIYEAPPPPLPPAEVRERRDLGILLNKVKVFWIEGVLEKSVHNMALIDLGKETQAEAVAHAWDQVLELPDQNRQTLPPDKKISHIFDEMNRALLILGDPGTGKTITLLQLARDLIAQVEQDKSFTEPVPVIFNLSTWSKGEPLMAWLVAELSVKYQIPKRIGQPWLEQNRLLPLLDGLDEVHLDDQAACVEAINAFGEEFGLSGLVVCSRVAEYTALPVRLKLNGAIRLQPLTLEQVYDYLEAAGEKLGALRAALQADDGLQTLARSPLTLGVMSLAYQDMPVEQLAGQGQQSLEARRKHIFDAYIERMFRRKGKNDRYTDDQTKERLAWLAQQMSRHNQTIFLIEQLQPSWLASQGFLWAYVLLSRTIVFLIAGPIYGLIFGLILSRVFNVTDTLIPGVAGWLVWGLIVGPCIGLSWGFINGIRYYRQAKNSTIEEKPTHRQQVLYGVGTGLSCAMIFGLITGLFAELWLGLISGLTAGLIWSLYLSRANSGQSLSKDIFTVEALNWSWQRGLKNILFGFIGGLIFGLMFGWVLTWSQEVVESLLLGPIAGLMGERFFVPSSGLFFGMFGGVLGAMFGGLASRIVETKTSPNQGMRLTLRNALLTSLGFGLILILVGCLIFGLAWGRGGLDIGVVWGLFLGMIAFLWYGGYDVIKHYTLRRMLWYQGHTPLYYAHFLDYAAERVFLQKVGAGYIFIHRLLLEHFASMKSKKN